MSEQSKIAIKAPGYYLNHGEKESHREPMRIEANLQTGFAQEPDGIPADTVWLRIREDTPMSSGGCETGIRLTIQEADKLLSALLDIIHYVLPERRTSDD